MSAEVELFVGSGKMERKEEKIPEVFLLGHVAVRLDLKYVQMHGTCVSGASDGKKLNLFCCCYCFYQLDRMQTNRSLFGKSNR